jgi:murein DD-endopeptidase MepM/ murein hydrolase activator NlpD
MVLPPGAQPGFSFMARTFFIAALTALALASAGSPAAAADGFERFPQPAAGTEFNNDYGSARNGHSHQGNDIFGSKGDPVVAVLGGIVTTVSSGNTAGNYVVIEHTGGWETWYLHLNNDSPGTDNGRLGPEYAVGSRVEVGWYLPAGAVVGFVGDSGNAEWAEPHTHFELHIDGRTVNPYRYLIDVWVLEQVALERLGRIA